MFIGTPYKYLGIKDGGFLKKGIDFSANFSTPPLGFLIVDIT